MRSNRVRSSATETASGILVLMILAGLTYSHFSVPKHFKQHDATGIFVDW